MTRVLVTGATGFVGLPLCRTLSRAGYLVRAALRTHRPVPEGVSELAVVGNIGSMTDWSSALRDVDAVVHAAARAHVLHDTSDADPLYMEANAYGTRTLASAAATAGISRFVYLSSVKVNGEQTTGHAFSAADEPHPLDSYGRSKWLGETYLSEVAARTGMKFAVLRSPLVYGPGVRANFLRLLQWVDRQWPMPFAAIRNSRSLVSVWNLCDLLTRLLNHPAAPGRVWMASDAEDVSTAELVRRMGRAMGRRVRLVPIPVGVLNLLGRVTRRQSEVARLCGSLVIDVNSTRRDLAWSPPLSVDEGLKATVEWYLSQGRKHGN